MIHIRVVATARNVGRKLRQVEQAHVAERWLGNKADVAEFHRVAPNTVDAWLRRGLPYKVRGSRGVQWVFDLLETARWRFSDSQDAPPTDPDMMNPRERIEYFKARREERLELQETRQLVPVAQVREQYAHIVKTIAEGLSRIPDLVERETGASPAVVEAVEKVADGLRAELHAKLTEQQEC